MYIEMPLFSDTYYTYAMAFEGNSYNLEFIYSERTQLYHISLYDAEQNPIVVGAGLVPGYPILLDYALFPLTGYIFMEEKATLLSEPYKLYPDSIDQYYNLYYIFPEV